MSIFKIWLIASTPWPHGYSHTICLFERPPNVGWPCVLLSLSLSWLSLVQGICDNHQVILQKHQVTKSEVWSLLQLTPIGLRIFNNALLAFSFSNTFLSLGKPLIEQNFLIFSKILIPGSFEPPFTPLIWSLPTLPALLGPLGFLLVSQSAPQKLALQTSWLVSSGNGLKHGSTNHLNPLSGQAINSGVLLHLLLSHLCPLILPSSKQEATVVLPTLSFSTSVSILLRFLTSFYSTF